MSIRLSLIDSLVTVSVKRRWCRLKCNFQSAVYRTHNELAIRSVISIYGLFCREPVLIKFTYWRCWWLSCDFSRVCAKINDFINKRTTIVLWFHGSYSFYRSTQTTINQLLVHTENMNIWSSDYRLIGIDRFFLSFNCFHFSWKWPLKMKIPRL